MGAVVSLEAALADRRLFRGGQPLARGQGATPSGFEALDAVLPWHGFPRGALTEILLPAPGLGELELLSSAWRRIGEKERLAFLPPPRTPSAPALWRAQWPLARFAWIEAPPAQTAWAAEQCLRAGCLGAVAFWWNGGDDKSLRRLQLAAEEGSVHAFVLRPLRQAANASPAALRLVLEGEPGQLRIRVLKMRGAVAPAQPLQRARRAPQGDAVTLATSSQHARRVPPEALVQSLQRAHRALPEDVDTSTPVSQGTRGASQDEVAARERAVPHSARVPSLARRRRGQDEGATFVPSATTAKAERADIVFTPIAARVSTPVVHDANASRTARAYRTLRALLASRNLHASVAARRLRDV